MKKLRKVISVMMIGLFAVAILSSCAARKDRCPTGFGTVDIETPAK